MKPERFVPLVVVALLCLALGLGLSGGHGKVRERAIGRAIGDFTIPVLGMKGRSFSPERWKGHAAIITLFASWCEPCQLEHETLLRLRKATRVPIYGIAWKDRESTVANWLKQHGNPYTLVGFDAAGDATLPFSMTGVPETFILDSDGIVRFHSSAALTDEIVEKQILPLLKTLEGAS